MGKVLFSTHLINQCSHNMSHDDEASVINHKTIASLSKLMSQPISPINVMM